MAGALSCGEIESGSGATRLTGTGGAVGTGARAAGGISSGGASTGGATGTSGSLPIVYDTSCPDLNFLMNDVAGSDHCSFVTGYCSSTIPVTLPACCLPSGECGVAFVYTDTSWTGIFPPNGCDTYAQVEASIFSSVSTDPHQGCVYPGRDASADAFMSTDASPDADSGD